jgi:hypothetical protein
MTTVRNNFLPARHERGDVTAVRGILLAVWKVDWYFAAVFTEDTICQLYNRNII